MNRSLLAAALLVVMHGRFPAAAVESAAAPRLHWDTSEAPGLQGGGGTWNADALAWNPVADGSAARVAWQSGAIAVFDGAESDGGKGTPPRVLLAADIEAAGIVAHAIELVGGYLRVAGGGLAINSHGEVVLSCGVGGGGSVALTGSGSVVLTRPTAAGGWTLQSGTLRFFDPRSLGTGTLAVTGNATLAPAARNIIVENPLVIDVGTRLVVESRVAPVTLAGHISGGGELVATDRGGLVIRGRWAAGCRLTVTSGTVEFAPPQPATLLATVRGGLFRAAKNSLAAGTRLAIASAGAVAASGAADGIDAWAESGWIAADSTGAIAIDGDTTLDRPLDLARLQAVCPKLSVGASGSAALAGGINGAGATLRLGGGGGLLDVRAPITGPVRLVVGGPGATGAVTLAAVNTFSGGITVAGATLRVGHPQAIPPGPLVIGDKQSNEHSCGLDLADATLSNPVRLAGRASIRNAGGGEATFAGSITAGPHRLRLAADHGSTLRVTGAIESTSLISVNCDHLPPLGKTNVVELSPASPNTCATIQVDRGLVLRARDGVGLPQAARLVLAGGVLESHGEFTREPVRADGPPHGSGGIALLWNRYHGSGFSARGGTLTVRLSGDLPLVWGRQPDGSIEPAPRELVLNAPTADGRLEWDVALDLAGETRDLKGDPTPLHTISVGAGTAAIVQPVSNSGPTPAGIKKTGVGALMLGAANTYDGPTVASEGTVVFGSAEAIGGSGRTVTADAGAVVAAGFPIDNAFLNRLASPTAVPFTVALAADSDRPLDFGSDAGAILRAATLGVIGNRIYSGEFSPCDRVVRLGGGDGTLATGLRSWDAADSEPPADTPAAATLPDEPPVTTASANDRWIDAVWTFPADPPGGFAVELSHNGGGFEPAGTAWPGERRFPIYLPDPARDLSTIRGELSLRVAAIASDGTRGQWSNVAQARPAARFEPDVELARRFPGTGDARRYSVDDPVRLVEYSAAEKEAQWAAGRDLALRLHAAAADATAQQQLTIPPGIYRVAPGQIKLKNMKQFTIHAAGVKMIVDSEKSGAAFTFEGCADIVLTGRPQDGRLEPGLEIDSEQFAMSVARIVGVNVAAATLDVEILPGYETTLPDEERMIVYRPDGRMANFQQMGWKGVEPLAGRSIRLGVPALSSPRQHNTVLAIGNLLSLHNNIHHSARTHVAVGAHGCRNMTYESIRIVNGVGQPADQRTAGDTVYRGWRLMPTPGTSRLEICGGLGQFSKEGGRFIFEDCEFAAHLDDGINLLSKMGMVARQDAGATIVVVGPEPTPGQVLTFHDFHSWKRLGTASIVSCEKLAEPETLAAVNSFSASKGFRDVGRASWRAKLDRPIALGPFAVAIHSDHRADEIVVRGCLFRDQLAQVMLLQGAKRGLIENNLILRSTGPAVSLQFSQYWWEGPMPGNFVVRNNVIRDNPVWTPVSGMGGSGSISVWAGTGQPVAERILSGFRIEGNVIENPAVSGILLRNAEHAVVRFNRIVNPGAQRIEGEFRGRPAWQEAAGIRLDRVSHAVVTDNDIVLASPWCRQAIVIEDTCDAATVTVAGNRVDTHFP
ncbi:MAG: right-handed parallel beta-helix repeat-containing protein [Planctomycetia bacterium]|nr:right-handed parallel beta-helix repeat-containing protein [Planctomycetia bacterium]